MKCIDNMKVKGNREGCICVCMFVCACTYVHVCTYVCAWAHVCNITAKGDYSEE